MQRLRPPSKLAPIWQQELLAAKQENEELKNELLRLESMLEFDFSKAHDIITFKRARIAGIQEEINELTIYIEKLQNRRHKLRSIHEITDEKAYLNEKLNYSISRRNTAISDKLLMESQIERLEQENEELESDIVSLQQQNKTLLDHIEPNEEIGEVMREIAFEQSNFKNTVRRLLEQRRKCESTEELSFLQALELVDDRESLYAALGVIGDNNAEKLLEIAADDLERWRHALELLCSGRPIEWWRKAVSRFNSKVEEDSE